MSIPKKNIGDIMKINEIKEKLFNITENFASKTGDYALITKLTMEIKTYETKIATLSEKLGKSVYKELKENSGSISITPEINELANQMNDFYEKINKIHQDIEEIKSKAKSADIKEDDTKSDNESEVSESETTNEETPENKQ
jgi:uncharacterized coiled-coil DUF342 family protein